MDNKDDVFDEEHGANNKGNAAEDGSGKTTTKNSKVWIIIAIVLVLVIASLVAVASKINKVAKSISVIGGADGPTAIFLAGKLGGSDSENIQGMDIINSNLKLVMQKKEEGISHLPLGMYLRVIDFTDGYVTVEIDNQSGYEMVYGYDYYLDKAIDGSWVEMTPVREYAWDDIGIVIKDLEVQNDRYNLNVFGQLEPGKYRLRKIDMEAEFELIEKQ